jgi:iron complex outermembrane recepter protein
MQNFLNGTGPVISGEFHVPCHPRAGGEPRRYRNARWSLFPCIALLASVSQPVLAQSVADDAPSGGLEEIVVTAQRRAENLQEVPISITAVTSQRLQASGIAGIDQLGTVVPGLNVSSLAGVFQPAIRGISTSSTSTENPVALYIDGVYYQSQREGLRDLNDIEQVSVLKGPQGTLFGRNATAGVLQITTRRPSHDVKIEAGASYDNYQTLKGDTYITGGLGDSIAASLSLAYSTQSRGYGTALASGREIGKLQHMFSARSKWLFELGSRTEAVLVADYLNRADNFGPNYRPYPGSRPAFPTGGCTPTTNVYDSCTGMPSRSRFKGGGASLTVDHDLDFAKLVSISAYRKSKAQYRIEGPGLPGAFIYVDAIDVPSRSFSQELQLVSDKGSAFTWTAGLFYFYARNANDPLNRYFSGPLAPLPTSAAMTSTVTREKTDSFAAFGQADIKLLDATTLTLGARWTYEKRDFRGLVSARLNNGVAVPTLSRTGGSITVRKPTWRVALRQELSPDISAYVSYNRGFKSGGFNIVSPSNLSYQPEILDDFEAGLKSELFDRRLRLNIGGFLYKYKNLQVLQFINTIQTISNAAKAKIYGVDVDGELVIADGLKLSGGMTLLHSEFTSFPNATVGTARVDANGNPVGGIILAPGDASGNELPLAQKFTGTAALDYDRDVSFGKIHLNGTIYHSSSYHFEADNFLTQGGYSFLNASAGWTSLDGHYTLTAWGRNLLDKHVALTAFTGAFGRQISYGQPPRTYGVTGRVRW